MTRPVGLSTPKTARPLCESHPSSESQGAEQAERTPGEDADRAGAARLEAAKRALAEARERRAAAHLAEQLTQAQKGERNGRGGLDPVRYGDWEVKGIATDF